MARNMRFPGADELQEMRRKAAQSKGSVVIPKDADPLDRTKYELCRAFVDYLLDHQITQKQLAARMKVSEARVSEIVHYKIHRLTLDRLVKYMGRLNPKFSLKAA
ncbi:MAG: XRE family transcriptional regulator [Bdellovibrionia bacterium]